MESHLDDDQISRYFRRVELGKRFLTHGARPQTICEWTLLTPDQLERLRGRWAFEIDESLRGPSPSSYNDFFSSMRRCRESALFLCICRIVGAMPSRRGKEAAEHLPSPELGERLCAAVEIFREWEPDSDLDFERIKLLLTGLVEGARMDLLRCTDCPSFILIDKAETKPNTCLRCRRAKNPRRRARKQTSLKQ